jgi:iron(III) transport system substrate-binding protein
MRTPPRILGLVLAALLVATSCGDDAGSAGSITVYSGRSEELIAPLLDAFTDDTGIRVDAQYGDSADLALLIQTEGENSPADVFISQSPGALGLLDGDGLLGPLDPDLLGLVEPAYAAGDGSWVGITGRVRVIVYNEDLIDEADLPSSVADLTDPTFAGKIGVSPSNGSFQDFVTAMRNAQGDDATLEWLRGMAANDSPNYPTNAAIVEAVGRGEVPMGLVNHYYNLRALEADPALPSRNHFLPADDVGSLVIVTGGAVLASAEEPTRAQAQFVAETQEYPLRLGSDAPDGLPALDGFSTNVIDYDLLGEGLTGTIELIRESGIEQ